LLTTAATANAVLVVTSRVVFAMARDGLLPSRLAAVHRRTGAPWAAVLACGAAAADPAGAGGQRGAGGRQRRTGMVAGVAWLLAGLAIHQGRRRRLSARPAR
jgi:amino acid transporter